MAFTSPKTLSMPSTSTAARSMTLLPNSVSSSRPVFIKYMVESLLNRQRNVSSCKYEDRSCLLADGTVLIWNNANTTCEFTLDYKGISTYFEDHFVSNDPNLALTFRRQGLNTMKDCSDRPVTATDQGLVVRPLNNVTMVDLANYTKRQIWPWDKILQC